MENQVYTINQNELNSIKQSFEQLDSIWIAEIDGNKVSTWEDYADEIEKAFCFPADIIEMHVNGLSMDGYVDWMTDLDWLQAESYVLIIKNFKNFMKDDMEKKEEILWLFKEDVLPFWQSGVEQYVVEGKSKPFNVYLVD